MPCQRSLKSGVTTARMWDEHERGRTCATSAWTSAQARARRNGSTFPSTSPSHSQSARSCESGRRLGPRWGFRPSALTWLAQRVYQASWKRPRYVQNMTGALHSHNYAMLSSLSFLSSSPRAHPFLLPLPLFPVHALCILDCTGVVHGIALVPGLLLRVWAQV